MIVVKCFLWEGGVDSPFPLRYTNDEDVCSFSIHLLSIMAPGCCLNIVYNFFIIKMNSNYKLS